jgi:pimeloyl-ACP methyl ester carboxylesterase
VYQLRGLSDVLKLIALDLPGHRESDPVSEPTLTTHADAACRALRLLETGPVFVAGHSLGGAVAQVLATRYPEMVKGLILVSTCAKVPPQEGSHTLLGFVPAPFRRAVVSWAARKMLLGPSAPSHAVDLTLQEIGECPAQTIQHDTRMGRGMDLESVARGLRVPTLILCGSRDRLTAPALSQELSAMIAGSRLQIVPVAGHMLPLESPEVLNKAIREFVASVTLEAVPSPRPGMLRRLVDRFRDSQAWRAWRLHFR